MKIQLLALLPVLTYTRAKPHNLHRRALGDACLQDSECDAGVVCSATTTSGGSTVCANADIVDGGACQIGSQCASTSCTAGVCDVTGGGGGGGLANDGDACTLSSECASAYCSAQICVQPSTITGLEFGSICFDSTNCLTGSECGCADPSGCTSDQRQCLRLAPGVACTEDIVCGDYYCLDGICAEKATLVQDGDHCILDSNCPAAVAPSTSPSVCQCPPGQPTCTGTDSNVCLPPSSGGGGGSLNDGDSCSKSSECTSAYCSGATQTCEQPSSVTNLEYGSRCFDNANCRTNSVCGCGVGGTCTPDDTFCLRVTLGLGCTEDNDCDEYFCSSGTCVARTTVVADGEHCVTDSNCPAAVAPSTSPSTCGCPPDQPGCFPTDKFLCFPPGGSSSTTKIASGEACTDSPSCFSGLCDGGTCAPLLSGADLGGECSADPDCLGWSDNENISSSYCQVDGTPPTCKPSEVTATGKDCAGASQHCFSGLDRCIARDGSEFCDPPTTLAQSGEYCSADADCEPKHKCSGTIVNTLSASRGIVPGQCVTDGTEFIVIVATGGDCDGTTRICYSGKDQCSSSKCLPPKAPKGPGGACSATEDCATPITGTVSCNGINDVVGSGVCTVTNDSTGGEVTETVTTTRQVTTTINGVVTVQPQTVTLTQRVGGGGSGGGGTTRTASPVSRTASASARPSSAASRSLGEVGIAMGAVGVALAFALL